ncbi:DUF5060 domain-containing protein [Phycisphaera mikurensis]|uniref:DUF5060 domain-containing protein n=1 Tax=Phycisphaera mikurensis (strain NBRC 102666 / KCTC 22515 / FYK2301M01) TaxID=1142394 RepID=I0IJ80_PHYMF|nr:DUF5060 domain-containing protein [Phycisphaera mikurensis]MBB6443290.1 hypothetical protein [Phycisphaera mikurensis]BAM05318.1 hypothetical protein PSMK_31590 [Phycisphaera mikurensis NBRC 102666]
MRPTALLPRVLVALAAAGPVAAGPALQATEPAFGWVPGVRLGGETVFDELNLRLNEAGGGASLLRFQNATADAGSTAAAQASGRLLDADARFTWSLEREAGPGLLDGLRIHQAIVPGEDFRRGDTVTRLLVPAGLVAGRPWRKGNGANEAGAFPESKPSDGHVLLEGSSEWIAWQLPDARWIRVRPDAPSVMRWQLQDNRVFDDDRFELQLYGRGGGGIAAAGTPIDVRYTIDLMDDAALQAAYAAPPEAPAVDRGPGVAMLVGEGPAGFRGLERLAGADAVADLVEFRIDLDADYQNPFDPEDVRLDAEITGPDGRTRTVPAFFQVGYERALRGDEEVLIGTGEHGWRLRFRPDRPGTHSLRLSLDDGENAVRSTPTTFHVDGPFTRAAFIRISPENRFAFATAGGEPYVPIGLNTAWPGSGGTHAYDRWWADLADHGGNFARIWLAPTFNRLGLERPEKEGVPSSGVGRIDQQAAARVDYLMELAEARGIRVMMCIESFGNFRSEASGSGQWYDSPYNAAHGGPLTRPQEVFTDAEAQRLFRNRLRYLVARWGHSTSVFAWEFWNEVLYTDGYEQMLPEITRWHAEMADYLGRIDPYDHLVTTSIGGSDVDPGIDALPGIDLTQSHLYGVEDIPAAIRSVAWSKAARFDKPHLFGEFGTAQDPEVVNEDPEGLHLREMLWSAIFSPTPGTAMAWWWDHWIEPNDLWHLYGPVAAFTDGFDAAAGELRQADGTGFAFLGPPPAPDPAVVSVRGGFKSWRPSPWNQPTTVDVHPDGGFEASNDLASVMHGANHEALRNPVTFNAEYLADGVFTVDVQAVSGHGGAHLKVYVDGTLRLDAPFPDPDGDGDAAAADTQPLEQHNGRYSVPVQKGAREIVVVNDGQDWMTLAYELEGVNLRQHPWLVAHTLVSDAAPAGTPAVLGWVRSREARWTNRLAGAEIRPCPASRLTLSGLRDGDYALVWIDTADGGRSGGGTVAVRGGTAEIDLPEVEVDLAFRLTAAPGAGPHRDSRSSGPRGRIP